MTRMIMLLVALGAAGGALAEGARPIPIQHDLRRMRQLEPPPPREPVAAQSDPTGVAGFSGPPGIYGDSVGSYAPLPPGASGNEE